MPVFEASLLLAEPFEFQFEYSRDLSGAEATPHEGTSLIQFLSLSAPIDF
jgi:hypothetical protein